MKELERLLKALADKNRLRILKLLEARKMCVCELAFVIGITQPSVSRHLKKLGQAGLIESEQDCFWTNYYIRSDHRLLKTLLSCLKKALSGDGSIKADAKKLKKVDRTKLCCRRER
jgi:ArsR family transcriptional regulator, arsenate/arsenite/antimonite-responsive transcriptional repressor